MSTQSDAVPESFESRAIAPAVITRTQPFYWSVRRELWENRSIYIAPLAAAGIFLFGFLLSTIRLPARVRAASLLTPAQQHELIQKPYVLASLLIMATTFIVAIFYCLDALHGERRDRSILFWKSLPVSDLTTVLAKASIPIVVLPLLTFAITAATQWIMLLLSSAVLAASGLSAATLWSHLSLLEMWVMLFYHLVAIHGLWYAPMYGWLLLVSGWARRAVFLWAAIPLLVVGVFERIAFNTSHFAALLHYRFKGGPEGGKYMGDKMALHSLAQLNPGQFLISPGLWTGLVVTALFLAAAVWVRRYRGPI